MLTAVLTPTELMVLSILWHSGSSLLRLDSMHGPSCDHFMECAFLLTSHLSHAQLAMTELTSSHHAHTSGMLNINFILRSNKLRCSNM